MSKDKKAFGLVKDFIKHNILYVLAMMILYFVLNMGEERLSPLILSYGHTYLDYALAAVRMFLQTALSCILIFIWYKKKDPATKFSLLGAVKLFCSTLLVSLVVSTLTITVIGIPFAVWFFLRSDFFMNIYFTSDKKGIISSIGESFRRTKGQAKRYLIYNLKFLSFYFIITVAFMFLSVVATMTSTASTVMSFVSSLFTSVFMPYRFLIKCGFYDEYLNS